MQYTVFISQTPTGQWQATVPVLPNFTAEAPTRDAVLEQIKNNLTTASPNSFEAVQIEVPMNGLSNELLNGDQKDWPGFGSHPNDPDWGNFFEELDRQRQ